MKILLGVVLALALLFGGFRLYAALWMNPAAIRELRENPQGERAAKVMLITLPSGRTIPVNYLREDPFVFAGADFPWWRELRGEGAAVTLLVRGEVLDGHARAIENDPERRAEVFARLRPDALPYFGTLVEVRID